MRVNRGRGFAQRGVFCANIPPPGLCGGTILLKYMLPQLIGPLAVTAGTVILAGREPMALPRRQRQRYRCRHMGMIFQNPGASFDPVRPYGAQFRDTLKSHGRYDARRFAADAEEALGRLGLTDPCRLLACRPYELSGGMNRRMAAVFVSHDLALVSGLCSHLLVMRQGRVVEEGPPDRLVSAPCHPYTCRLISSVLELQ